MEIKRSIKRSFAVLGAIGMLVLAGCGGGSGGGGTAAKTEKPGIVKLVEEKGKNLTVNTVKLKYVVLASEVKKLKPPSYMPTLVYQKDAFYGIDKATKSMVKLVIKDGTFVVENANVIPNVQYIFGTDGENIYYRPEGKMPTPRVLTKDGKDGGSLFKNYYAYVSPAKDGKISRRSRMYETFSERLPNQTSPAAAAARAIETPWTFSFETCSAASLVSAINFASDSDLNAE